MFWFGFSRWGGHDRNWRLKRHEERDRDDGPSKWWSKRDNDDDHDFGFAVGFKFFNLIRAIKEKFHKPAIEKKEAVVDFNELQPGETIETIEIGDGAVTIDVFADRNGSDPAVNDAMIFNADQPPRVDPPFFDNDLLGGDGGIAIITENNDPSDPDDAVEGGVITFDFSRAVDMDSIVIIDVDNNGENEPGAIIGLDENGDIVGEIAIVPAEDGEVRTFDLSSFDDVSTLEVRLASSGAVDDLSFHYEVEKARRDCDHWHDHCC